VVNFKFFLYLSLLKEKLQKDFPKKGEIKKLPTLGVVLFANFQKLV
jgi:hypothetical protein